jgi:hypothetical protein
MLLRIPGWVGRRRGEVTREGGGRRSEAVREREGRRGHEEKDSRTNKKREREIDGGGRGYRAVTHLAERS